MHTDRVASLYPMVKESETPLPRKWNKNDKFSHLKLVGANELRVSYQGPGKSQKDAAAVRTLHPIPPCGFYYFEIKVINKGKDGYIGVGLCQLTVNLNRLPGWDKHSWGYHGDDGHSFNSSGTGKPYGPVFVTGDVIGCGLDLVTNSCFYTKNGTNLGNVFFNLPKTLYPTVGLQSTGEVVEANFGQQQFVFDFDNYRREIVSAVERQVLEQPIPFTLGKWDDTAQRLVSDYLIHYGYHSAALEFARVTGQNIGEQIASMKSRQEIQQLVLNGQIERAVALTDSLYPQVFIKHPDLLFRLKVRQFIDLVATVNFDILMPPPPPPVCIDDAEHQKSRHSGNFDAGNNTAAAADADDNNKINDENNPFSSNVMPTTSGGPTQKEKSPPIPSGADLSGSVDGKNAIAGENAGGRIVAGSHARRRGFNQTFSAVGSGHDDVSAQLASTVDVDDDVMDVDVEPTALDANSSQFMVPATPVRSAAEGPMKASALGGNKTNNLFSMPVMSDFSAIEKTLRLGREVHLMWQQLGDRVQDSSIGMMREAFSLLAYKDLATAPMAHLLDPAEREPVCVALNSAILSIEARSAQPPINMLLHYAVKYGRIGARNHIGASAFATPQCLSEYVNQLYSSSGATAAQATSSMDASDDH